LRVQHEARDAASIYHHLVPRFLQTMCRITDPERSRAFYADQESVLELTYNHDGRTYDLGPGYGHIAVGVEDLDGTLSELAGQGIEPERPPYSVREGGSRLCFVRDPDGNNVEVVCHNR
jgi:catechol 2,3-dioxygenase-like lactoylglutathione lyase family enzyme